MSRKGSGWIFYVLYAFTGGSDGEQPDAPIAFGPDGVIYSTTFYGGGSDECSSGGCGTVYSLRPSANSCKSADCPWTETVLHRFTGSSDGGRPGFGALAFDKAGNLYGTTTIGGQPPYDAVIYGLTRSGGQEANALTRSNLAAVALPQLRQPNPLHDLAAVRMSTQMLNKYLGSGGQNGAFNPLY